MKNPKVDRECYIQKNITSFVDTDFIDTYAAVGRYLREIEINTPSRISMLSSLIHLQEGDKYVNFDEIYEYSLEMTEEKLEHSSFRTLIKKLKKANNGESFVIEDESNDHQYRVSPKLKKQIKTASNKLKNITDHLKDQIEE